MSSQPSPPSGGVENILTRHSVNPIIHPRDYPDWAQIFNPSPVMYQGKTVLLLSVIPHRKTHGQTHVAWSDDGIHFDVEPEPFFTLEGRGGPYDIVNRHLIDNRVSEIDGTYYILTPVGTREFDGPAVVLGKTRDFKSYELMDIVGAPRNRGASLFPARIGGQYYKLDRPGGGTGCFGTIWLSSSPDLIHWGRFRPVLRPFNNWNWKKIGPTPPIRTDEGWLVILHGVTSPPGGTRYSIGAMLLDLDEPWRLIGRTMTPLLTPEAHYELHGTCDNTVFPCGAIAIYEQDRLRLYYGAGDHCIALATGSLNEVVQAAKHSW